MTITEITLTPEQAKELGHDDWTAPQTVYHYEREAPSQRITLEVGTPEHDAFVEKYMEQVREWKRQGNAPTLFFPA